MCLVSVVAESQKVKHVFNLKITVASLSLNLFFSNIRSKFSISSDF